MKKMMHSTRFAIVVLCLLASACSKQHTPEAQPVQLKDEKAAATMDCCLVSILLYNGMVSFATPAGNLVLPAALFNLNNVPV